MRINVAIDGPAGAGKSTAAKAVARKMNIRYLDTGAMYRGMALYCLRSGVDVKDEAAVRDALAAAELSVRYEGDVQHVYIGTEDVTGGLRTPEMSMAASDVSKHPSVRIRLTELQRAVAREYDVVMDGRDIGTNVLKDSPCKIFLTASPEERAKRRYEEMAEKGQAPVSVESILLEICARDKNDSERAFMPLRQAEDAVLLDTTGMSIEEVVAETERIIRDKYSL